MTIGIDRSIPGARKMQIDVSTPMPSRPCRYCLSLQEDSVFADFDVDGSGRLALVRISFDGYGCCRPSWDRKPATMPPRESERLIQWMESGDLDHSEAANILRAYFTACGEALWAHALKDHHLT